MYEEYWGLKEKPFQNTPNPRFLYYSQEHEEALGRLTYTVKEGLGAAMLVGVFGCGKTLIGQALLEELGEGYKIAFITNPNLNHVELLREIAYQLGAKDNLPREKTDLMHLLNDILRNNMNDGKETVVIIDEAHIIEDRMVFEELRLLLNLQLRDRFLLTLMLLGQPELEEKIIANKQLSQRIAIKYRLERLTEKETHDYVVHRLKVVGRTEPIFSPAAMKLIFKATGGIPRRINHLCEMSLLIGFGRRVDKIGEVIVQEAAKDLVG